MSALMLRRPLGLGLAGCLSASAFVQPVLAQTGGGAYTTAPVTVTATRTSQGRPLSSIPGSVTIIDREEIQTQAAINDDLGGILSQLVPGFAPSSQSMTNYGQTLRGRSYLVLIDGVPQSTPLRDVSRDLRVVDPNVVERIEVIRGAVATYGYGATGGIINIITRDSDSTEPRFRTELGADMSLTHPGDSLGGFVSQGVEGAAGKLDYTFNVTAETVGGFFDAEGDRIPPDPFQQGGLADSRSYNLQSKLGYQLTENQRLRFSINYYDLEQNTDYSTVNGNPATGEKATTVENAPPGEGPGNENLTLSIDHTAEEVLGGTLSTQVYYQDFQAVFGFSEFFPDGGGQSKLTSEKLGARIAHDVPIFWGANLVYGVDFLRDQTTQVLLDGRTWVPEIDQTSYAPFAQLEVPVGSDWLLRGGARFEAVSLEVDDYRTLFGNRPVEGGTLDYHATVFNIGAVYYLDEHNELFASFSQGFSVADVGDVLRSGGASSVEALDPDAQIVDNYELGWRGYFDTVEASLALFYNTSDLGTTFTGPPDFENLRRKQEIYGVEASIDWQPLEQWGFGGTASWAEGKVDTDDDDDVDTYLPGTRISPAKLTAYAEYSPTEDWRLRVQAMHLFDRDRFGDSTTFGEGEVDGYTLVDLYTGYDVGPGELRVGIQNILNEQYIIPLGQAYNTGYAYAAGRGATLSVSYGFRY